MHTVNFSQYPDSYSYGKGTFRSFGEGIEKEWLITNGIGGYANQTIIGSNSRSFSGILNISINPPTDRYTLLANMSERIITDTNETIDFFTNKTISETYKGQKYLSHFDFSAYPTYTYQAEDFIMQKSIGMVYGKNTSVICYSVQNGISHRRLLITPFFAGKPLGATVTAGTLKFEKTLEVNLLTLNKNNPDLTIKFKASCGKFIDRSTYPTSMAEPTHIVRSGILYDLDVRNGLNDSDNYFTPYDIEIELAPYEKKDFYFVCSDDDTDYDGFSVLQSMNTRKKELGDILDKNDALLKRLAYSADNFIVHRKSTNCKSVLAGYPWFLDWGRDTMIAFTGLALCTHRFDDARSILKSFAMYVKNGLLPNVFPNTDADKPIYNTMDASMWYFYAVYKYLEYDTGKEAKDFINNEIYDILEQIIDNYMKGTDFSIHMDDDYLVSGGSDLDQITWMDVRVGDLVVTPRHGKPVEINALWYNALKIMEAISPEDKKSRYSNLASNVKSSFVKKFWNEKDDCLYDVIGKNPDGTDAPDSSIRPNQLVAVSLPFPIFDRDKEKAIVNKVYSLLYTPLGIRTLSPMDKEFKSSYIGRLIDRDKAYHMGTAWGYITGQFITAYVKANGNTAEAKEFAALLLQPVIDHLSDGCLGGVAEIFDGSFPCTSRGCYSQAWSVAELIRAYYEDIL